MTVSECILCDKGHKPTVRTLVRGVVKTPRVTRTWRGRRFLVQKKPDKVGILNLPGSLIAAMSKSIEVRGWPEGQRVTMHKGELL